MTAHLTIDDTEARAAAQELRSLVGDGDGISLVMRDRIAAMLGWAGAVELVAGPHGLAAHPSGEMLSIIATLRAHQAPALPAFEGF